MGNPVGRRARGDSNTMPPVELGKVWAVLAVVKAARLLKVRAVPCDNKACSVEKSPQDKVTLGFFAVLGVCHSTLMAETRRKRLR